MLALIYNRGVHGIATVSQYSPPLLILLRSIQKPKSLRTLTGMYLVMHVMCLHNPLHVWMLGDEFYSDSSVNNNIVKDKIEDSVESHSQPNPKQKPKPFNVSPQGKSGD